MRFIALLTTAAVIPSGVKRSRGIYAFTAFYADGSCEDPLTRYRSLRMTALLRIFIRAINENLKAVSIQKEDALRPLSVSKNLSLRTSDLCHWCGNPRNRRKPLFFD